jgi:hypothetical protein
VYKRILFPFSPGKSFNTGYNWAMELAGRMNASLLFFTTVPSDNKNNAESVQRVYHSLLEAQGSYLQQAHNRLSPAKTERHIEEGEFTWSLSRFVKSNRFDIVVIDPTASSLAKDTLDYVVENSDGVIVLPEHQTDETFNRSDSPNASEKKLTEDFYNVLHQADLYKLHDNFFSTLGQDKTLFNYLRGFFKKKQERN